MCVVFDDVRSLWGILSHERRHWHSTQGLVALSLSAVAFVSLHKGITNRFNI